MSRYFNFGMALAVVFLALACKKSAPRRPGYKLVDAGDKRRPPSRGSSSMPAPLARRGTSLGQFLRRGTPTFVVGTSGSDLDDHRIATQVALMRGLVVPRAKVIADGAIDVSKGPKAWPTNPLVYGRADQNTVVARIASRLPFEMTPRKLVIAGKTIAREGIRLIAVVPARSGPQGYPEFVFHGGTGAGGMAEINAKVSPRSPITIVDQFGILAVGYWKRNEGGNVVAVLKRVGRRISFRKETRTLRSADGKGRTRVTFAFPARLPKSAVEEKTIAACMRGLARAVRGLAISDPIPLTVYLYPSARMKGQITGNSGDGHVIPSGRALHMRIVDPSPRGGLENLMAHEATHVLGYYSWGPTGTALMGEGVAVWIAQQHGGVPLRAWPKRLSQSPPIAQLLSVGWRKVANARKYPIAGLLVDEAVKQVGLLKVRKHLYPAGFDSWEAACRRAGTSPERLQAALAKRLAGGT